MVNSHKYNKSSAGGGVGGIVEEKNLPDFPKDHIFHLKSCLMHGRRQNPLMVFQVGGV